MMNVGLLIEYVKGMGSDRVKWSQPELASSLRSEY